MSTDQPLTEQDYKMMDLILKESCKRESGFCPGCNAVLVPELSVSIDLIVEISGHVLYRNVACATCFDSLMRDVLSDTAIPPEATWRIIDGRKLYRAPQRQASGSDPKADQAAAGRQATGQNEPSPDAG